MFGVQGWIVGAVGALALTALAGFAIHNYGSQRYEAGIAHQRAEQAKTVATQTKTLTTELTDAQLEARSRLESELSIAKTKLEAANAREVKYKITIKGLRDEIETNCTSVNSNTLRLLNSAACAYNLKRGIDPGNSGGEGCPKVNATGQ